jgi:hypothetical protein
VHFKTSQLMYLCHYEHRKDPHISITHDHTHFPLQSSELEELFGSIQQTMTEV